MRRSSRFTPARDTIQTITVLDGIIIPSTVSEDSIIQTSERLRNGRFMLWHDGQEIIVNAKELRRILSPDDFSTVLSTAGSVAIVDNRLVAII